MVKTKITSGAVAKLNNNIQLCAALISIILSIIVNITNSNPLNIDGLFYLQVAKDYLQSGWYALVANYSWPAYILAISWVTKFTHLSLLHSAELLDLIFYAMLIYAFIGVVKELGGSKLTQWFAAILILVFPELNTLRTYVIRDVAYWAFIFFALWQLIKYSKKPSLLSAVAWGVSMFFAVLFRIEGIFLWVFTPFALLLNNQITLKERTSQLMRTYVVPFVCLIFVLLWTLYEHSASYFHVLIVRTSMFDNIYNNGFNLLLQNWGSMSQLISNHVLNQFSSKYSPFFVFGGFLSVFVAQFLALLEPLPIVFSGYAIYKQLIPAPKAQRNILYVFTYLNLIIPIIWIYGHFFLSARYLMLFVLTILIWTPFGLEALFVPWKNHLNEKRFKKILIILTAVAVLIMAVCGVYRFGHSKAFITNAGYWLAANTPKDVKLFANCQEVMFYADRSEDMWLKDYVPYESFSILKNNDWKKYDYLALRINQQDVVTVEQLSKQLDMEPVKIFKNDRGDEVLIYKVINHH